MDIARSRTLILIIGLLIVIFITARVGINRIHKDMGHPVGDNAVTVYNADPSLNAPDIVVHSFIKNEPIATSQMVNVYIKYSYEDHDILELAYSVLIVTAITLILYFSTFVFK